MSVRSLPGGRLAATAPVKLLIMNAYGLQRSEIDGGPDWINNDRYEIDAKAEEDNADRARLMLMLQSLLEDRFQLRSHRETRETPVYALNVDKKGPKLTPYKEGACPTAETSPVGRSDAMAPPCGQIRISSSASSVRMEGNRVPIAELIRVLAVALSQPVIDRTALSGIFDIRLQFVDEAPGAPAPDSQGPSVFEALADQLGLRLTSAKGPVEFLLIDHIERPSAN